MTTDRSSEAGATQALLSLRRARKNFGTIMAVDGVDFVGFPGEVVGLCGDNGAGKSTVMKMLNGFYPLDEGTLFFDGKKVRFGSPADARAAGIETVYQDLALIESLTVWRNFFLGREIMVGWGPFKFLRRNKMRAMTAEWLSSLGLTRLRSPNEGIANLSGGERQGLAIGRANYFGGRVLLLDEPTTALGVKERANVVAAIAAAKAAGTGIVVIDHNIRHLHEIADRIVVMENGKILGSFPTAEFGAFEISEMVAGRHALGERAAST